MIASFSDVEFQKRFFPDDNKDGNGQWLNFNVIFDDIKRSDSIQIVCMLSAHIPAAPNMVKEHVSNKATWKYFGSSEKKWLTKAISDWNKIDMELLFIQEFLMKQYYSTQACLDIRWL